MLVLSVLESMRNEDSFNNLYDVIVEKSKTYDFIKDPVTKRKRNAPKYSLLHFVEGHKSNEQASHPATARDRYRGIFYEALDALITSIKDRFNQPSFVAYTHMEEFLLKSIRSLDTSVEEEYLRSNYAIDINVGQLTRVECDILRVLFKEEKAVCFKDIVSHLKGLGKKKELIPNVVTICKLLLVNPATTATAERSFSLARRVKTWMRSNMVPRRFNSVAILHSHKKMTDEIDLKVIANDFAAKNDRRKRMFGRF